MTFVLTCRCHLFCFWQIVLIRRLSLQRADVSWHEKAWCNGLPWSQQMKSLATTIGNVKHYTQVSLPELENEERPVS